MERKYEKREAYNKKENREIKKQKENGKTKRKIEIEMKGKSIAGNKMQNSKGKRKSFLII